MSSSYYKIVGAAEGGEGKQGENLLKVLTFNRIELIPDHLLRHECSHLGTLWLSHRYQSHRNLKNENCSYYFTFFRDVDMKEENENPDEVPRLCLIFRGNSAILLHFREITALSELSISPESFSLETNFTERG